jgi:predicted choloylglycine hydrolase
MRIKLTGILLLHFFLVLSISSCTNTSFDSNNQLTANGQSTAYWQTRELDEDGSLLILEVAGSYYEIGLKLGEWYRDHGFIAEPFSEEEREEAKSLVAFYESVDPRIVDQIRGMYRAFNLDFEAMNEGVLISDSNDLEILLPGLIDGHSCSVVFVRPSKTTDGHALFGRNYDFPEEVQNLTLLFTYPDDGYPTAILTPSTPGLTAADGINSQGLALGFASVADNGYVSPPGDALISSFAYRYVLEHSANVEEAVRYLQTIPIRFIPSTPAGVITHVMLADKTGDSAVVEFLPEGVVVSRSETLYQVMTNNLWANREERESCWRYCLAVDSLESAVGSSNISSLMSLLSELRGSTQYSVIYDLEDQTLRLSLGSQDYSEEYEFSLADFIHRISGELES